jgi:hypothetical protein
MNFIKKWKAKRERRRQVGEAIRNGRLPEFHRETYVMDVAWERAEELRVDRLGPNEDDVVNPERVRVERWRPLRTLGGPGYNPMGVTSENRRNNSC